MREANPSTLREFETWLTLLADGDELPERDKWKAWFCVAEYEDTDFEELSTMLAGAEAAGSFAFLGRDAWKFANAMQTLDDAGHEIAFHSHRHHAYATLPYEEAHDAITTGMAAIEESTGITPDGFFVPFMELSDGAVRAVEDVGFEWVVGTADRDPAGVTLTAPVTPFDAALLEEHTPGEAMDRLRDDAASGGAPFLFHPPVVEYYDGLAEFREWVQEVEPTTVADQVESGGTGVVLDCVRPVRVE